MSEMVKKVAQAMALAYRGPEYWDAVANFRDMARDAIEAMREPTEAMWVAPAMAEACVCGVLPSGEEAEAIWKSMIDEALRQD